MITKALQKLHAIEAVESGEVDTMAIWWTHGQAVSSDIEDTVFETINWSFHDAISAGLDAMVFTLRSPA